MSNTFDTRLDPASRWSRRSRRVFTWILAMVVASTLLLSARPSEAYCFNGSHMNVGFPNGFGDEYYRTWGTCNGDTLYVGKNRDTLQDGVCIYTVYAGLPGTVSFSNCLNSVWANTQFDDTDQTGTFYNCKQVPGIDPCSSVMSMSGY